jgi:hypothetical protein
MTFSTRQGNRLPRWVERLHSQDLRNIVGVDDAATEG